MSVPSSLDASADRLLTVALRGEVPEPRVIGNDELAALLRRGELHGVLPLLHGRLQPIHWPEALVEGCRTSALSCAVWEMQHSRLLVKALDALAQSGMTPIIFKGTALAGWLYPAGCMRWRSDTDLLLPEDTRGAADEALRSAGFRPVPSAPSNQCSYVAAATDGGKHVLDVHWKISNSELLSRLFDYAELRAAALPLTCLHPRALAASPVHSLLIACMHRAAHRINPMYVDGAAQLEPDRLIWVYDIHLLASRLSQPEWVLFVTQARCQGLSALCAEALLTSRSALHTSVPGDVLQALQSRPEEAPERYLRAGRMRQHIMDMLALPGWRARMARARNLVLPPADYMLAKYSGSHFRWLPWLYLRRLFCASVFPRRDRGLDASP